MIELLLQELSTSTMDCTSQKNIVVEGVEIPMMTLMKIELNNIRMLPSNQYRSTTDDGVNKIIDSIQKIHLRPHLMHVLVQQHVRGCECEICSRNNGTGMDLFGGFHRIEAIKKLEVTNPEALAPLRNDGKIWLEADVMASAVSRQVVMAEAHRGNELHSSANKDRWYHTVHQVLKNFSRKELENHNFVTKYWNPVMPFVEPRDKNFQRHRYKAKWIFRNDMKELWLALFKHMKGGFKGVHVEKLMKIRDLSKPVLQATLFFMVMLESSANFTCIALGVKVLHEHQLLPQALHIRTYDSFMAFIRENTPQLVPCNKRPTLVPLKKRRLNLPVSAELKIKRAKFSNDIYNLNQAWNEYLDGMTGLGEVETNLANVNASFEQIKSKLTTEKDSSCLEALLSLNRAANINTSS